MYIIGVLIVAVNAVNISCVSWLRVDTFPFSPPSLNTVNIAAAVFARRNIAANGARSFALATTAMR